RPSGGKFVDPIAEAVELRKRRIGSVSLPIGEVGIRCACSDGEGCLQRVAASLAQRRSIPGVVQQFLCLWHRAITCGADYLRTRRWGWQLWLWQRRRSRYGFHAL